MRGRLTIDLRQLLNIPKFSECFYYANKFPQKISQCLSCAQRSDDFLGGRDMKLIISF